MSTTKWSLDPTHSEIQFKIKHLMISTVTGSFNKFNGTVTTHGEDFSTANIEFSADVDSISTNNEQRDAHLKNGDFFDTANHPQLIFKSEKLEKTDDETYKVYGTLNMRGVTNKVVLNAEFGGITVDPWGNTRVGFEVTGKINRYDYGISFGAVTETGGLLLGDEVKIFSNVELVKQAVAEAVEASA